MLVAAVSALWSVVNAPFQGQVSSSGSSLKFGESNTGEDIHSSVMFSVPAGMRHQCVLVLSPHS